MCEIKIDGYDVFTNILDKDGNRGIAVYIKSSLHAQQVKTTDNEAKESIWCEIPLKDNDKLLLGTVYRSPNSTTDNNKQLNNVILNMTKDHSHVLVVGDFNYPDLDWAEETSPASTRNEATVFMEAVRDSFLWQHVQQCTHHRAEQNPTLIDLIFTNEQSMVKKS